MRKTQARKTNIRKSNIKDVALRNNHKEENNPSFIKVVSIEERNNNNINNNVNINKINTKENVRITKARITKCIQKTVNILKEDSDDSDQEKDDFYVINNPLKKTNNK